MKKLKIYHRKPNASIKVIPELVFPSIFELIISDLLLLLITCQNTFFSQSVTIKTAEFFQCDVYSYTCRYV